MMVGSSWRRSHLETRHRRGFSLVEMMVVITAIGILTALAVPRILGVLEGSKAGVAEQVTETFNAAVVKYNHSQPELVVAANSGISDEQDVITALTTATGDNDGSPFLSDVHVHGTDDTTTYRAVWSGRVFTVAAPGASGTGVDLLRTHEP